MAAKAVCFAEAGRPDFADYAHRIVANAQALADELQRLGATVATGGTDNHIVLLDVAASFGLTGRQAESALLEAGVVTNRNSLPADRNGAWYTSGIRLGTPALTTLGLTPDELREVADIIVTALRATTGGSADNPASKAAYRLDESTAAKLRDRCAELLGRHRLYPDLEIS
jgi:glycine hydroxymethyltransferase